MNLKLTGNHVEITDAMRDYVTSKISKIKRHFDHVIDVSVILSVEKLKQKAEANVHVRGKDIFVETDRVRYGTSIGVGSRDAVSARAQCRLLRLCIGCMRPAVGKTSYTACSQCQYSAGSNAVAGYLRRRQLQYYRSRLHDGQSSRSPAPALIGHRYLI